MTARSTTHSSGVHRNLNPNLQHTEKSATLAINERSMQLQDEGRDIIRLGLGQSPFPVPDHVAQALRDNAHQKAYLPVQGLPELRQAVAGYLERTESLDYSADQIMIGPGTKELMFTLQLAFVGELVIPAPSWVSYAPQANIIGRKVSWLPTNIEDGLRLTPATLEAHCATAPDQPRLLILNYPGNPTGVTYRPEQLEAIADVARRYNVLILSDEIYSGLTFASDHVSIARFYPEGTIISNGLSKWCGAGGWRIGAFAFPENLHWLLNGMTTIASETFTSVSAPVQYAAIAGFEGGEPMDLYLRDSRRILKSLMTWSADRLRQSGARVCEPEGAFYLFPHFDDATEQFTQNQRPDSSQALCQQILEQTGVALLPGSDFGHPPAELFVRLAEVDFDGAAALAAIAKQPDEFIPDEQFLRHYCGRTVAGIDRLCAWLNAE
jgi:aspartate aminotransferase